MDIYEKRRLLNSAENEGRVADSTDVRMDLMERVRAGEITLQEAQKQLKAIKRGAKKSGKVTRNQAYNGA